MDPIFHILVGIHLSLLQGLRTLAWWVRLPLALLATTLPEADRLLPASLRSGFWGKTGPLHSLAGAGAATLLVVTLCTLVAPQRLRRQLASLFVAGVAAHLLLDALTIWGLPLAWPLHPGTFGLGWIYEKDPWILFLLAAPLVVRWLRGAPPTWRSRAAPSLLVFIVLYVSICGMAKGRAIHVALRSLGAGDGSFEEVRAYPAPYGPLLWTTAVRTDKQRWLRGVASAALGGFTPFGDHPTGEADPRMQVALTTPLGARYGANADALFLAQATDVAEDGSFEVALGDLRFSDPFSDHLPWVLWLRIGPDFSQEAWRFVSRAEDSSHDRSR